MVLAEYKSKRQKLMTIPCTAQTDKKLKYVRYAELRGICSYYGMASNFCKLHYFAYLMEYSCLKTLASKHKTSLSKIIDKLMMVQENGVSPMKRSWKQKTLLRKLR